MADVVAGKTIPSALPSVITFAKRITLRVTLQDDDYSHIYPPLLIIEYSSREYSSIISSSSSEYGAAGFNQEYTHQTSVLWQVGLAFFIISLIFGCISAMRRMAEYFKKSYGENIEVNFGFLLRFIIYLYDSISNFFFWLLVIISFALFLFYKGQQDIYFLLPPLQSSETRVFFQIVVATFVGKICYILWQIYRQIQLDILLIDWEKPKDLSSTTNLNSNNGTTDLSISQAQCEQATVWRKIFILHKWHDLQSYRSMNIGFLLVFFVFLMKGLSIENLAFSQPSFTISNSSVILHPILYFALTAFFLGILYICHRLFSNYVWNRYYTNPLLQFIDLLYLCNISMFCSDERYHAYYIHGKSVHRNADVTMHEMHRMMQMESKMWTKERGLQNGVDTFEWYFSRDFRTRYDREFVLIIQRYFALQSKQISSRRTAMQSNQFPNPASPSQLPLTSSLDFADTASVGEKVLSANASFNAFMCAFIEKSTSNYSYECLEHSYWTTWFGLPAQLPFNTNKDIFFYDRQLNFRNTLPISLEVDWLQMLITCFALSHSVFDNILVSMLICYCVDRILMSIRTYFARVNMCKKACIEEKFLR
jgi:meckelin